MIYAFNNTTIISFLNSLCTADHIVSTVVCKARYCAVCRSQCSGGCAGSGRAFMSHDTGRNAGVISPHLQYWRLFPQDVSC